MKRLILIFLALVVLIGKNYSQSQGQYRYSNNNLILGLLPDTTGNKGKAIIVGDTISYSENKVSDFVVADNNISIVSIRDSIAQKAGSKRNFKVGDIVETKGLFQINDGGGARYFIRDTTSLFYNNGASDNFGVIKIANGKYAHLMADVNGNVNLLQFGALGNNTTNDAARLQSALNYTPNGVIISDYTYFISTAIIFNKPLFFTKGGKIRNTSTLTFNKFIDNNTQCFTSADTLDVSGTYIFNNIEYVRPEWFGAVPNDNINDLYAIRECFLSLLNGGTILLNQGTYLIQYNAIGLSTVGNTNITIQGQGKGTRLLKTDYRNEAAGQGTDNARIFEVTNANNFAIKDLAISQSFVGVPLTNNQAVLFTTSKNVNIDNVLFENCNIGIAGDLNDSKISNCFFTDNGICKATGIALSPNIVNNVIIENCTFHYLRQGIEASAATGVDLKIINNKFIGGWYNIKPTHQGNATYSGNILTASGVDFTTSSIQAATQSLSVLRLYKPFYNGSITVSRNTVTATGQSFLTTMPHRGFIVNIGTKQGLVDKVISNTQFTVEEWLDTNSKLPTTPPTTGTGTVEEIIFGKASSQTTTTITTDRWKDFTGATVVPNNTYRYEFTNYLPNYPIHTGTNLSNVGFIDNYVTQGWTDQVYIRGNNYIISNNIVKDGQDIGINTNFNFGIINDNLSIHNGTWGIWTSGNSNTISGNRVIDNTWENNVNTFSISGIGLQESELDGCDNNIVTGNYISSTTAQNRYGIVIDGGKNNIINNNVATGHSVGDLRIYRATGNNFVSGNTFDRYSEDSNQNTKFITSSDGDSLAIGKFIPTAKLDINGDLKISQFGTDNNALGGFNASNQAGKIIAGVGLVIRNDSLINTVVVAPFQLDSISYDSIKNRPILAQLNGNVTGNIDLEQNTFTLTAPLENFELDSISYDSIKNKPILAQLGGNVSGAIDLESNTFTLNAPLGGTTPSAGQGIFYNTGGNSFELGHASGSAASLLTNSRAIGLNANTLGIYGANETANRLLFIDAGVSETSLTGNPTLFVSGKNRIGVNLSRPRLNTTLFESAVFAQPKVNGSAFISFSDNVTTDQAANIRYGFNAVHSTNYNLAAGFFGDVDFRNASGLNSQFEAQLNSSSANERGFRASILSGTTLFDKYGFDLNVASSSVFKDIFTININTGNSLIGNRLYGANINLTPTGFTHTDGTSATAIYGLNIDVNGATNNYAIITNSESRVGFGTAAPTTTLHVSGTNPLRVQGLTTDNALTNVVVSNANGVFYNKTNAVLTDNQSLSIALNQLSISDGNSVDLASYLDNTDGQTLSLATNTLSITGGNNVDLTSYLDNTDTQDLSLTGNDLSLTDGGIIDLSIYLDNTDTQDLSLSLNTLSLTDGGSVDLTPYLDNTDGQTLSLATNTLSITGGNSVDLTSYLDNTDNQSLSIALNQLSISGSNSVDLTSYLDNTDGQNLTFRNDSLFISGGNSVVINTTYQEFATTTVTTNGTEPNATYTVTFTASDIPTDDSREGEFFFIVNGVLIEKDYWDATSATSITFTPISPFTLSANTRFTIKYRK